MIWEGEVPDGFVLIAPVKALFNHTRNERFTAWVEADLAKRPVDRVIGFNKMPGLDVYYAADPCFEDKAQTLRNPIYRRWGRYKHFAEYERAVFAPEADRNPDDLRGAAAAVRQALRHAGRALHLLPPGIAGIAARRPMPRRSAPSSARSSKCGPTSCCWCRSVPASRPGSTAASRPCLRCRAN